MLADYLVALVPLDPLRPRFHVEMMPSGLSVNTAYSPAPSTSSRKASLASGGESGPIAAV